MPEILLNWQGLGYYSRAKRVHQSSKLLIDIIGENNSLNLSCWPVELSQWMILPGIVRTTAGSIFSSAFDLRNSILDGNVTRILSRLIINWIKHRPYFCGPICSISLASLKVFYYPFSRTFCLNY